MSSTYITWQSMMQRCGDPNADQYPLYGGRGIKVCDQWRSFEAFLADMGERPPGTTLDRYPNNDGHYEPGNCRWATNKQQGRNRRQNRIIEVDGRRMTLIEWSEMSGIDKRTLRSRLVKGWPPALAVSTPPATRAERGRLAGASRRSKLPIERRLAVLLSDRAPNESAVPGDVVSERSST